MQGKWIPTEQFTGGKAEPKGEWIQVAWEFNGDRVTISMADFKGRAMSPGRYDLSLDSDKKPAHLDLSGPHPKVGFIAIYKLDGDNLTICWNVGRTTRPTAFETSREDFYYVLVMKREK